MGRGWITSAGLIAGCSSWPRWSASDEAPALSPTEADGAFTWGEPLSENEGANDDSGAIAATLSSGNTVLGVGELETIGWCSASRGPACENAPPEGCTIPFGDPRGVYAGDVDTWALDIAGDGPLTLCARAELEPGSSGGEAVFDLLLVPLDGGCPLDPTIGAGEDPLGYSIGPDADGWSAPVEAGTTVAVLLAGALAISGSVDETFPYRVGFAVVPTAPDGGITHCPLLPGETSEGTE